MKALRTSLAAAFLAAAALAGSVEIHGRPLRGLTLVPVADLLRSPASYAARAVRISGRCERTASGALGVREADAVIALETVGYTVPENVVGARIAAEGRVGATEKGRPARFLADGMEVTR